MSIQTALDEYNLALKQGQKEYRELVMEGRSPYPAVLDDILAMFLLEWMAILM